MAGRGKRSVIDGVRSAVEQSPDNESLRLHLATALNDEGEFRDALEQVAIVLEETPDHVDALAEACRAAEGLGADRRAAAYRLLHVRLAWRCAPRDGRTGPPPNGVLAGSRPCIRCA
jgi:Flp pilus assembly protein TadD